IRGTQRAGAHWPIREVTVHYNLAGCPGQHVVIKTYRKRPYQYQTNGPEFPWEQTWTETEMVDVGSNPATLRFDLPLIDDFEVELVSLVAQSIAECAGCGTSLLAGGAT